MSACLEIPRRPADKHTTAVVVLYAGDEAFTEAVAAWSPEWATRVQCWKRTGKAHGVYVVEWSAKEYEPLFLADDDEGFTVAIGNAIARVGNSTAEWRSSSIVRPVVAAALWEAGRERREERHREHMARRRAEREARRAAAVQS